MYRENADFGVIAVLRTFYLSGIVAGLSIYLLSGNNRQKIAHFENIDE